MFEKNEINAIFKYQLLLHGVHHIFAIMPMITLFINLSLLFKYILYNI